MNPCKRCNPSKIVFNTMQCSLDRLFNSIEDFKSDMLETFGKSYIQKYQCKCADLVEKECKKND